MENSYLENRKKWVDALRSGKYKQGTGRLCFDDAYCCLGVACEVYQKEVGNLSIGIFKEVETMLDGATTYDNGATTLPKKVAKWLNITNIGELIQKVGSRGYDSLVGLNDGELLNFNKIADIIENGNLKEYEESL